MDSGELRHRVAIQSVSLGSADSYGQRARTWATDATVWAKVEPLSGDERMRADQVESSTTHRITIRHRSGVSTKCRLLWGSRILNINSVANIEERDRWIEMLCEEMEQETA